MRRGEKKRRGGRKGGHQTENRRRVGDKEEGK